MGTSDRVETSRRACECGKGEFIFYTCEANRWLYVDNPLEQWFEMIISCEPCTELFPQNKLTRLSEENEARGWKLIIPEANQVPLP